jgi:hypothetical protein
MCPDTGGGKLRGMKQTAITASLELHPDGDSLTGNLREAGSEQRPFTGWLGLLAAIGALVDAAQARSTDDDTFAPAPTGDVTGGIR